MPSDRDIQRFSLKADWIQIIRIQLFNDIQIHQFSLGKKKNRHNKNWAMRDIPARSFLIHLWLEILPHVTHSPHTNKWHKMTQHIPENLLRAWEIKGQSLGHPLTDFNPECRLFHEASLPFSQLCVKLSIDSDFFFVQLTKFLYKSLLILSLKLF